MTATIRITNSSKSSIIRNEAPANPDHGTLYGNPGGAPAAIYGTLWEQVAEDATWRKSGHPHNGFNAISAKSVVARMRAAVLASGQQDTPWGATSRTRFCKGIIRAGVRVR